MKNAKWCWVLASLGVFPALSCIIFNNSSGGLVQKRGGFPASLQLQECKKEYSVTEGFQQGSFLAFFLVCFTHQLVVGTGLASHCPA